MRQHRKRFVFDDCRLIETGACDMASRGKTVECKCKCCRKTFTARVADRQRGWAKYCSKSCKAKHQEQRTGQFRRYQQRLSKTSSFGEDEVEQLHRATLDEEFHPLDCDAAGPFGN